MSGALVSAIVIDPLAAPAGGPATLVAADAVRALAAGRRRAAETAALRRTLPDAADLLAGALAGGASLALALAATGRHAPAPAGPLLEACAAALARGDDVAGPLREAGAAARPLAALLAHASRLGSPLADDLRALADDLRAAARVDARAEAARAGVRGALAVGLLVAPGCLLLVVGAQVASLLARSG